MACCNNQSDHLHTVGGGRHWVRAMACCNNQSDHLRSVGGGKHWVRAMAYYNNQSDHLLSIGGGKHWGGNTGSEQWPAATTNPITYSLLEGETLGQSNGLLQQPI
ncbi:hypothetical protein K435DRAFT_879271 [Dendrothele bispora CBS 962.96]|uniref:Uncharacterized protein n=1 Tax=Dendrothele bispora (strain CBS 962.96) TaxID=1314807 RepID=A0A4V4HAQ3_DENBC|nr:hypothetical protein K435DRAFT_879271 [Dendrothele bispora CBS 962.96]